jgi:hypothetical protein
VPGTATTGRAFQAAYRRVRYCFHAIVSAADPPALPKNRRLTQDELKARTKPITPGQATAARDRLEALVNALLEASVSVLTQDERAACGGGTALDATPVPLFSRGPSKRTGLCASDPDGGWYVREGDHRDREDGTGKPLRKICWALEATITVTARPPGTPPATPNLATGMAMARPGQDPGGTGARVLASVAARGRKTGWPGYDRACTQAFPDRFHLPARALGYHLVMDYRDDQPGIQASTGGALLVEGSRYCPAIPGPLITATTGLRDHAIDRELYDQQVTARTAYQLKRKDGPDTHAYQHLSCPALGTHPGLMCPLRPASLSPRDGRPKVLQPPEEPPKICRQTAITIAPGTGARYRQDLPYGTPAWHARYATLRNTIEGLNGLIKDTAHEALAAPARRRVRGITACSLFTALLLMAPTSARSAPGAPSQPATRPASPAAHGDAAPACATTSQTADNPRTRRRHDRHHQPGRPRPTPPARCKPAARARSTTSPSPFTVSTTPPRVTQRPFPGLRQKITGRAAPQPTRPPCRPVATPATPLPEPRPPRSSARCRRRRTLTHVPAGTRHIGIFNAAENPLHRIPERRSTPVNKPAQQPEPISDPAGTMRNGHRSSSVGTTPAVLSVTPCDVFTFGADLRGWLAVDWLPTG